MHALVMFAQPFRMPDFFLISGLVPRGRDRPRLAHLSRPQGRALRLFLRAVDDDPVRLQGAVASPPNKAGAMSAMLYLESFIEPFGTLWFIYLLPIFFVVTKLTRGIPAAGGLARRRGAGDGACRNRLDRDRRVLRALRLFLFRLSVRCLRVRAVGSFTRARPALALIGLALWALDQWRPRDVGLQPLAADLAGARACGRRAPSS